MGFVVHLELKSVKISMVMQSTTILVDKTNPTFSFNG